jgi:RNA polymerase sigma-70 factor (ECF subfamily)
MKPSPSHNETELIQRACLQDEQAFAALVDIYTAPVYRVARRMVTDTQEAEAIVQETFWRFWKKLPFYRQDAPLLPYLATIASNLARDRFRRERWLDDGEVEELLESRPAPGFELEQALEMSQSLESLERAVESLPMAYRAVISLRYDAGMDYEEIARALSLPLNTVRTHLRRAKQKLREEMEAQHG